MSRGNSLLVLSGVAFAAYFVGRFTAPSVPQAKNQPTSIAATAKSNDTEKQSAKSTKTPAKEAQTKSLRELVEAAIAEVDGISDAPLANGLACQAFRDASLDALLEYANAVHDEAGGGKLHNYAAYLLERWGELDFAGAVAWLQKHTFLDQPSGMGSTLIGFARMDLSAAFSRAYSQPPSMRTSALQSVLGEGFRKKPRRAMDLFLSDPNLANFFNPASLLNTLARTDAALAEELAKRLPQKMLAEFELAALNLLSEKDPLQALEALKNRKQNEERDQQESSIISAWATRDPAAAIDYFRSLKPDSKSRKNAINIFSSLITKDPQRTLALLSEVSPTERKSAISLVATGWASSDPQAAIQWACALQTPSERREAISNLANNMNMDDPGLVDQLVGQMTNEKEKTNLLQQILGRMAYSETPNEKIKELFDQLDPYQQANTLNSNSLAYYIAKRSISEGFAFCEQLPANLRGAALGQIFNYYGQLGDTEQLIPHLEKYGKSIPDSSLQEAYKTLAANDPQQAMDQASKESDPQRRLKLQQAVLSKWMESDPTAVYNLTKNAAPDLRSTTLSAMLSGNYADSPEKAIQYTTELLGTLTPEKYAEHSSALTAVSDKLIYEDPEVAKAWLRTLPVKLQEQQLPSFMDTWASQDPVAASTYLRDLPVSQGKDEAIGTFVSRLTTTDPESAAIWIGQIQNQENRRSSYLDLFASWYESDKAAAEPALKAAQLGDEFANALAERLK
jgi:serine/threonine protein kinase